MPGRHLLDQAAQVAELDPATLHARVAIVAQLVEVLLGALLLPGPVRSCHKLSPSANLNPCLQKHPHVLVSHT